MSRSFQIYDFLEQVFEAAVYVSPLAGNEQHLSIEELVEIGSRHDFTESELRNNISIKTASFDNQYRIDPKPTFFAKYSFSFTFPGDPKRPKARDWVLDHFSDLVSKSTVERFDLASTVARGEAAGFDRDDIMIAIDCLSQTGWFTVSDGVIGMQNFGGFSTLHESLHGKSPSHTLDRPNFTAILSSVRDVVRRRNGGKPISSDPRKAFNKVLRDIGTKSELLLWWTRMTEELAVADIGIQPSTKIILSAALVEGALSMYCRTAFAAGLSMKKHLDHSAPTSWKLESLAKSAKSGSKPIISQDLDRRVVNLNERRQTIHAARWIDTNPYPDPEIRAEEVKESEMVLDLVLRAIIDWHDKHGPKPPP